MTRRTPTIRSFAARLALGLLAVCATQAPAGPPPSHEPTAFEGPIPVNPAIVTGELENGLRYTLLPTGEEGAGTSLALVINAGSVHERPGTSGVAMLAPRLAFSRTDSFEQGELEAELRENGVSVTRRENVTTTFDRTMVNIDFLDANPDALRTALRLFADYAGGMIFDREVVDRERDIAKRDLAVLRDVTVRLNETLVRDLFPGSPYAEHPSIGTERGLSQVTPGDLAEFAQRRYTTKNMTLVAAGAFNPQAMLAEIEGAFQAARPMRAATDHAAGAESPMQREHPGCRRIGVVLTDDDLHGAAAYLIRFKHAPTAERTARDLATVFARDVAHTAFRQRLNREICNGVPIHQVQGGIYAVGASLLTTSVAAGTDPLDWNDALGAMTAAARDASAFGFTEREIESAKRETTSNFASRALDAVGDTPAELARQLATQEMLGSAPMLLAERAQLATAIIPTLDHESVNRAFADLFDPDCLAAVVLVPSGADAPSDDSVAACVSAALRLAPENRRTSTAPVRIAPAPHAPGSVERIELHPSTGVLSAWLSNGTRLHHLHRTDTEGRLIVSLTLAGGRIDETAETRGLTRATEAFWRSPATRDMTTCDVRDALAQHEIDSQAYVGSDAVRLTFTAPATSATELFELIHAALAAPSLERRVLETWRSQERTRLAYTRSIPRAMLNLAINDAIYPVNDPRHRALNDNEIDALPLARTTEWLERLCAESPIELAIVGDLPREEALALAASTLGALPARDRIDERTSTTARILLPREHPVAITRSAQTTSTLAVTLVGFRGPGIFETDTNASIDVATRVLSARLERELTGPDAPAALVRASAYVNEAYADFGLIYAYASAPPDQLTRATQEIEHQFAELAYAEPSDEEVRLARKLAETELRATHADPTWWARRLSTITYRGFSPGIIRDELDAVTAVTPESIRDAIGAYYDSSRRVSITVTPNSSDP